MASGEFVDALENVILKRANELFGDEPFILAMVRTSPVVAVRSICCIQIVGWCYSNLCLCPAMLCWYVVRTTTPSIRRTTLSRICAVRE